MYLGAGLPSLDEWFINGNGSAEFVYITSDVQLELLLDLIVDVNDATAQVTTATGNVLHPHHDGRFGPQGLGTFPDDPVDVTVVSASMAVGDTFDLDATDIDINTLVFGPAGGSPTASPMVVQDVDLDGLNDATFEFHMSEAELGCSDTTAAISGQLTATGEYFLATAPVTTDCNAQCHN